jgi:predicted Holliday junction resolvase-like endonuclease
MKSLGGERLSLASLFGQLNRIMTLCPNPECGELFYLSEASPHPSLRHDQTIIDRIRAEEATLEKLEGQLAVAESALREKAAKSGLRAAKRVLKTIDPVFSGSGYDPQDVKVLFDPISYVVFDGLADRSVKRIVLLSDPAEDRDTERIHRSIESTVKDGNVDFRTMRVDDAGMVSCK